MCGRLRTCFLAVLCMSICLAIEPQDVMKWPRAQVERALPASHPMAYYLYAARLFHEEDKKDALFWYYVGEIRYRFYLATNPNLPPDGAPALFASLHESTGSVVVAWGKTHPTISAEELQRALKWDESSDNGVTSKAAHVKEWRGIRAEVERENTTDR